MLSVPHTGTRTLRRVLSCFSKHTFVDDERLALDLTDTVIASPLRDPAEVWKSWVRRVGTGFAVKEEYFDLSWERLAHLDELYDIIYVPLDHPERDSQFHKVEQALGESLTPDWGQREGHISEEVMSVALPPPVFGYEGEAIKRDLSWVYELPIIKRFYEQV